MLPPEAGLPVVEGGDGWSIELGGTAELLVATEGTSLVDVPGLAVVPVATTVDGVVRRVPVVDGEMVEVLGEPVIDDTGPTIDERVEAVVPDDVLPSLQAAAQRPSSAMSGTTVLANIVPIMEEGS